MSHSDFQPERETSSDEVVGDQGRDEDILLPDMHGVQDGEEPRQRDGPPAAAQTGSRGNGSAGKTALLGALTLAAVVGIGSWLVQGNGGSESQHPNWEHVQAATEASASGQSQMVLLDPVGYTSMASQIELSRSDANRSASRNIRSELARGNFFEATALLQAAQVLPDGHPHLIPPQIEKGSDLEAALQDREGELYDLELYDCCDEDGDVVEILVNGVPFATVPIVNAGIKVSVPLGRGNNTVSVRGVRDGGGGITISFRTSRGNFFCQKMRVGEEHPMTVVVQ